MNDDVSDRLITKVLGQFPVPPELTRTVLGI